MAQRRTTAQRKSELIRGLRAAIRSGELPAGSALPPLRVLGERHGLHYSTVQAELQPLIVEGLLRVEPRLGIFVAGMESDMSQGGYLFINGADRPGSYAWLHGQAIRRGFERKISKLGGYSITVPVEASRDRAEAPSLAGVFEFLATADSSGWMVSDETPVVEYSVAGGADQVKDRVHFDDFDGGRIATQHLIRHGHRRIAFMAVHTPEPSPSHRWSTQREAGWLDAMSRVFPEDKHVVFYSDEDITATHRRVLAGPVLERTARVMLAQREQFDAVVGSDDRCIAALVAVWTSANVPESEWPALMGFEGFEEVESHVLSSVIPPWEKIGETAAEILVQRRKGTLTGPPIERTVQMDLALRMSSLKDWRHRATSV